MRVLYSGPMSMFGAKAEIAEGEKDLLVKTIMVPFGVRRRYEPKHPEVLRVNPKGQVPVLIDGAVEIYDSTQIFEHLEASYPTPPLWPAAPADRAEARQLELASDEVFFPHVVRLMGSGGEEAEAAKDRIRAYRLAMDQRLHHNEWLAGAYSYADIAFFMADFFACFLGAPEDHDTVRLNAWRRRMAARKAVERVTRLMASFVAGRGLPPPPHIAPPEPAIAGDEAASASDL